MEKGEEGEGAPKGGERTGERADMAGGKAGPRWLYCVTLLRFQREGVGGGSQERRLILVLISLLNIYDTRLN